MIFLFVSYPRLPDEVLEQAAANVDDNSSKVTRRRASTPLAIAEELASRSVNYRIEAVDVFAHTVGGGGLVVGNTMMVNELSVEPAFLKRIKVVLEENFTRHGHALCRFRLLGCDSQSIVQTLADAICMPNVEVQGTIDQIFSYHFSVDGFIEASGLLGASVKPRCTPKA